MDNYKIFQSDLITQNHQGFVKQCEIAHTLLTQQYSIKDSTWEHEKYNIFGLTSSSLLFYKLYQELNYHIKSYMGYNKPLWMQCWINYHKGNKVEESLKYHSHTSLIHGYICIDPQNTSTIFKNGLKIDNKIGQIYIGPGNPKKDPNSGWFHKVKINQPSEKTRITLGFDVSDIPNNIIYPSYYPLL